MTLPAVLRWADLLELLTKTNPCEISSSGDERYRNLADAITGAVRP